MYSRCFHTELRVITFWVGGGLYEGFCRGFGRAFGRGLYEGLKLRFVKVVVDCVSLPSVCLGAY